MTLRWSELIGLFLLLPLLVIFAIQNHARWLMPLLVSVGLLCLTLLLTDKQFKRKRLWRTKGCWQHIKSTLWFFVPLASLLCVLLYLFSPNLWLDLPTKHPQLWLTTLLIYPLISVLPQELIFRTFFFHRYKPILPDKRHRWWLSSMLFGLAHMVYGNWLAVIGSGLAGFLFGYRYMQSKSTLVVAIEHTLWGSFIFTVGLGAFFLSSMQNQ